MKIILASRKCLAFLIITLILTAQGAAAEAQSLPASAFSALPKISGLRISPDGEKLIYFQNVKNSTYLLSLNLSSGKSKTIGVVDNVKYKFRYAMWANNDTVLYSIIAPYYSSGVAVNLTRLLVRKADASDESRELVKPGSGGGSNPMGHSQFHDNIISLLRDDPDHILVGLDAKMPNQPSVFKVNLNTSDIKEVLQYKKNVRGWGTDQQDRIRVGRKFNPSTTTTSFLIHDLTDNEWKEVWEGKSLGDDPPVTPLGFGIDPNILYVRADHNGRNAIFKVDVRKAGMPMELLIKDDKYDINGSLIYSRKTRDVVGVRHGEADGRRIYWDKAFKEFQMAIDKALPGTINYLTDFSDDEQKYIVLSTNDRTPPIFYLGDREYNSLRPIAHTYRQLEGKLRGSKKITYNARDGKAIEAFLTLPADHTPENPGPAVIFPHGGPMVRDYENFDYWAEFLASKGIIVLKPNFRGSSGYGWEFVKEAMEEMGLKMQDDLTDAANWLIEQGLADPDRIAIVGASYGGYAALMGAVKTPDLFKCAISFAGISDLQMLLKHYQSFTNYGVVLKQLGNQKKKLKDISPITHVNKIKIPILLGHGDEDRTVPVKQSQKMAKALKKKKKNYIYIELEKGDHGLSLQNNRHKFFNAMDEFLDKYLLN